MATKQNRFTRTNQVIRCKACGKGTTVNAGQGTDLCRTCYDAAGLENEHADGHHDGAPAKGCPNCEANE